MERNTTIFALATPYGKSSIAVIRISGPSAFEAIQHFKVRQKLEPRVATLTKLYTQQGEMIDQAILISFPNPESLTGEDVLEIQSHGGKAIIDTILTELAQHFIPADPGEFSKRAFMNNKMDLAQAEGLADLIEAETKMQMRQAIRQISGELNSLCVEWNKRLTGISAMVEATIDFPEDRSEDAIIQQAFSDTLSLIDELEQHIHSALQACKIHEGYYLTIIGPPNSGKSTLANYLTKRDLSIISPFEGTTRDILEARMEICGQIITIADTAGLRTTSDQIEALGINKTISKAREADIKLVLISLESYLKHGLPADLSALIDENTLVVLSKSECTEPFRVPNNYITISVHKKIGMAQLMEAIISKIRDQKTQISPPLITRERHIKAIQDAIGMLKNFDPNKKHLEICAEYLRNARLQLQSIIGNITDDEILSEIFSKFCIGK